MVVEGRRFEIYLRHWSIIINCMLPSGKKKKKKNVAGLN